MKGSFLFLLAAPPIGYTLCSKQQRKDIEGIAKSLVNSTRAAKILSLSIYDYLYELGAIAYNTEQYHTKRSEIHYRVANRILKLSKKNRGIYLKLGQYLGNLEKVVPKEFTEVLCVLQDSAPILPFDEIKIVVEEDLGGTLESYYSTFDKDAIAAASLAQVHRATLKTGEEVAVKIQYPFLRKSTQYDLAILSKITGYCNSLMEKSGNKDFDLVKLFDTWTSTLVEELDFMIEVNNALITKENFKDSKEVYIPNYYKQLSSSRIITMEFISGEKINNRKGIQDLGLDPIQVAKILADAFAQMIFKFRHIHCDAHPGNIFVRKRPDGGPQIVLLDHGLYRQVNQQFITNFGKLWLALVSFDKGKLVQASQRLNVSQHVEFLPLIFLHRTMESGKPLGASISEQDRKYLRSKDLANFNNINRLLQDLPPQLMFIIRATNLVVSHCTTLGLEARYRLLLYTQMSLKAVYPSWVSRTMARLVLYTRLFLFEHAQWIFDLMFDSYRTKV